MDLTVQITEQGPTDVHVFVSIFADGILKRTLTLNKGVETLPWYDSVLAATILIQNALAELALKGAPFASQKAAIEAKVWKL